MFLAEKDSIINSSKVLTYLQKDSDTIEDKPYNTQEMQRYDVESPLRVVWCPNLDHGMVFDLARWRARLKSEIVHEARMMKEMT